jgi:hypothetical protein
MSTGEHRRPPAERIANPLQRSAARFCDRQGGTVDDGDLPPQRGQSRPPHSVPSARRKDLRHVGGVLGVTAQPIRERGMVGEKLVWFSAPT